jgi:hypothetical protein
MECREACKAVTWKSLTRVVTREMVQPEKSVAEAKATKQGDTQGVIDQAKPSQVNADNAKDPK